MTINRNSINVIDAVWNDATRNAPNNVPLIRKGTSKFIYLSIPLPSGRTQRTTKQPFTLSGIDAALKIAHEVKEKLDSGMDVYDFDLWWFDRIKPKGIVGERVTINQAITAVERNYWDRTDKQRRKRDRGNLSHLATYQRCYGIFYDALVRDGKHKPLTVKNLEKLFLSNHAHHKGKKQYKEAFGAYCKLFRAMAMPKELEQFRAQIGDIKQTEKRAYQAIDRQWLFDCLQKASHQDYEIVNLFVIQIIYGLRVSEVYAIRNLDNSFGIDNYTFKSMYSEGFNPIYVGDDYAINGHKFTVKTGSRIAVPIITKDINFSGLLTTVVRDYKRLIPLPKFDTRNHMKPNTIANEARRALSKLTNGKLTQTHSLRHLANYHAKQLGMDKEIRAQSLGHSQAQNEAYNKHLGMAEQVKLLLQSP